MGGSGLPLDPWLTSVSRGVSHANRTPGRIHARRIVTVHVAADTITIDLASDDTRIVRRTTTQPVRSIKAQQPRKAAHVS
jgi:hypothetical protein